MKEFIDRHQDKISGVISCFDRVVFKGYLPLGWSGAMERLMQDNGYLIKNFKEFVSENSQTIKTYAENMAKEAGRPYQRVNNHVRKDKLAKKIAAEQKITSGLVCILNAVETSQSFKVVPGKGRPRIINSQRKCLCLYFYFIDPRFGLLHVRLPTWFPFTIQIALNGHEFLAWKMRQNDIGFDQIDNAFVHISDCEKAQKLADTFVRQAWPKILDNFAHVVNPLCDQLLSGMRYYWVTEQAEYATDILFRDQAALQPLYKNLAKYAVTCFGAEDVMTFPGRKLHSGFAGEIVSQYKKRWPGLRVKHRMKENWIKMYDKHGVVLRIETVVNRSQRSEVRDQDKRKGQVVTDWFPMAKGVANLYRYKEVSLPANTRYSGALAAVPAPSEPREIIRSVGQRVVVDGRSSRAFNPLDEADVRLCSAVQRGEFAIHGFQNQHIRMQLFAPPTTDKERRSQAGRTYRQLKRLHLRGLIAKIPRTRKWKVTQKGRRLMSALTIIHEHDYPDLLAA